MVVTVKQLLAEANAAVPKIAAADAARLVAEKGAVFLDVRDGTEVKANGKLKGAVAVQRGLVEFKADPESPTHEPRLRRDAPVVVYCASGGRAALAGKTLKDMGFGEVYNLGGFKDGVEGGIEIEPA
ncbi:MAG: rhodanese-like domain-containing protein [Alphaproteobacteria bacterium]